MKFSNRRIVPETKPDNSFHQSAKGKSFLYKGSKFVHYSSLNPKETAFHRLSTMEIRVILLILIVFTGGLLINWHIALILTMCTLTIIYFADLLFNMYVIYSNFKKPAKRELTEKKILNMQKRTWPKYTILCPLYKEWQVIGQFVKSMSRFDYPKSKLQIMLLLEQDDTESIKKIKEMKLPSYFEVVIVPQSLPKTKPKACNYGLMRATGEYVVIYDAEDVPDILQLKKAVLAFENSDEKTICVQARLNFYNPHQNILTKIFTAEYSLWFDLILTGLQSVNAPIPLGGTSNHFRVKDLNMLKGWDSFNVTEDADLGIRLVKEGYKTKIINSLTLEEANSNIKNWFNQRSRWIKGYIQTYLVHMRHPGQFKSKMPLFHIITFQLVIGGKILSIFINPLMWAITACYFIFRPTVGSFIETLFPIPIFYLGLTSLVFGNFLYMYYYMIGSKQHGHHELVKYAIFTPLYWLTMSVAAWFAVWGLIRTPHYWSKTKHGLHLQKIDLINKANLIIDKELTKSGYQVA